MKLDQQSARITAVSKSVNRAGIKSAPPSVKKRKFKTLHWNVRKNLEEMGSGNKAFRSKMARVTTNAIRESTGRYNATRP